MSKTLARSALLLGAMTVLTGIVYPLVVTGIAQGAFPERADGSLVVRDGRVIGAGRIGQSFEGPEWFHGRPSATRRFAYNPSESGGSNLGPANPALLAAVRARVEALRAEDPDATDPIPVDLVTASASGLDPDISPAAALWQVRRVARVRGADEAEVRALVESRVEGRQLGLLGEPRIDVLGLNLALEQAFRRRPAPAGGRAGENVGE